MLSLLLLLACGARGPTEDTGPDSQGPEDCENSLDDDGDALVDCGDPDCAAYEACLSEDCWNGVDDDGDGLADCRDPDCYDDEYACEWGEYVLFGLTLHAGLQDGALVGYSGLSQGAPFRYEAPIVVVEALRGGVLRGPRRALQLQLGCAARPHRAEPLRAGGGVAGLGLRARGA
ncbi:MAG: hypothetical protein H6740_05445 [Alphaproteobacteria bacterium]|nr:hypothetical protein [Alphaproteobacteria bacterium]